MINTLFKQLKTSVTMRRLHPQLLLFLVLGTHMAAPMVLEESEESEEASQEEFNSTDVQLTFSKSICLEAKHHQPESPIVKRCCVFNLQVDKDAINCYESSKLRENDKNEIFKSKFAYCFFKIKKFTKGEENLHFRRIKAYFDIRNDRMEAKFMLNVYKTCSDEAKQELESYKTQPGNYTLGIERPFFYFVMKCVGEYPVTKSCPYYLWEDTACSTYKTICREIMQS